MYINFGRRRGVRLAGGHANPAVRAEQLSAVQSVERSGEFDECQTAAVGTLVRACDCLS